LELIPESAAPGYVDPASDDRLVVAAAMRSLQSRDRELIALKFFAGLDNPQIARVLGISGSNAGTQLHRAITRLREQIGDVHDVR
jgi:RNA polymerase sigma-70 factor (ECF subfamily)